jgi:TPR repeat protein
VLIVYRIEKAATEGYARAQYQMGSFYYYGLEYIQAQYYKKDFKKALYW